MAKKSRRSRDRYRSKTTKAVQERAPQQPTAVTAEPRKTTRMSPKAQDLTDRYQHIKPELRRIGIIAGAMIIVLIVLSFVLPYIPHW